MKRYYIGGKQYVPEKSTELCAYDGIMGKAGLYRTAKGAFFLVDKREGDGVSARVVDEREAFAFKDKGVLASVKRPRHSCARHADP